jgi:transcriptional regulator with XRE-family HTH domain
MKSTFGQRLYELRYALQLTQQELADKCCTSQAQIFKWENDLRDPKLSSILRLAKVLKTTPEWLAFGVKPTQNR